MIVTNDDSYQVNSLEKAWTHKSLIDIFDFLADVFRQFVTYPSLFTFDSEANDSKASWEDFKHIRVFFNLLLKLVCFGLSFSDNFS